MYAKSERTKWKRKSEGSIATELEALVRDQLENALDAEKRGLKIYESLKNLSEAIGTQYGDRVLYELIQNAHDAHPAGDHGKITIKVVAEGPNKGTLYVANGGVGFRQEDVDAIRNIGTTAKDVGEGIGNKGLGFRSIEALTDDPRVYSQPTAKKSERFNGYCFRFGDAAEIKTRLSSLGAKPAVTEQVAPKISRYLVTLPLDDQPSDVVIYARRGYATVVVVPLKTEEAIRLATEQVRALVDLDVPLLLFLDRIGEIRIDVEVPGETRLRRVLRRQQKPLGQVTGWTGGDLFEVDVGDRHRFLMVKRKVEKARVLDAVHRSLSRAPRLTRWLDWKGEPVVSIAVSLNKDGISLGRLYNFLPMGERAAAPFLGYLDAPFFADIDRRTVNLDLPLNETLMEVAAEACAAAAISIVDQKLSTPPRPVFDLIAWTGDHARKLDDAFTEMGTSLREAAVIPTVAADGLGTWSSLSKIKLWPAGQYSVLKPKNIARQLRVYLVFTELGERRIKRLKAIAARVYTDLAPDAQNLSRWAEEFAATLINKKAKPRTWSQFYNDLRRLFGAAGVDIGVLAGKKILLDRSGKLRPSGMRGSEALSNVYIRPDVTRRKRLSGGVPLPPSSLARRYRFLDERVSPSQETIDTFLKAGLVRTYDPIEALVGLRGALGQKANENRRREALVWAFEVWSVAGSPVEKVLHRTDLHVPTYSGWQSAKNAAFSSSWTRLGVTVENYLVEAATIAADCRLARNRLLVPYSNWPSRQQGGKQNWIRFLELLVVVHGLRPVPAWIPQNGETGHYWNGLLRYGNADEGFDEDWCAEVNEVKFYHPNTADYKFRGDAWRLPGQIVHSQLSESAKESLCSLIFEHLKAYGDACFRFEVGRFDRAYARDWDERALPTPLASFLRSKPWVAAISGDETIFRRPSRCWAADVRRGGPPRFIDGLPETIATELSENKELADLVISDAVGFRDWQSEMTADNRLQDLALVASNLVAKDRPIFRREYQRAWSDAVATGAALPEDICIAVMRRGRLDVLNGDPNEPPKVIVSSEGGGFEARVLSEAGYAVLELGEDLTQNVASLLKISKGFDPRRLDGIDVRLLVDGEPFAPRATDPLLVSFGLEWLPDAVVVAHDLLAEQLEQGIPSSTVGKRTRAIRVRECETISLVVDDEQVSSDTDTLFYDFEHEKMPTLILTRAVALSWKTLGQVLFRPISRLIGRRLRYLEPLLLQLAIYAQTEDLAPPGEDVIARALDRDVRTVKEHMLALRTDSERVMHMLLPVVAYYKGTEAAESLRVASVRFTSNFDAKTWLNDNMDAGGKSTDELFDACERAGDRAELRRILDLDYKTFNQALAELGEPTLSNEPELRRLYEAHLQMLKPEIIDRLRRHHFEDFRHASDLKLYRERKELKFLPFDEEWAFAREDLEPEVVKRHVSRLLQETLGGDIDVELLPMSQVLNANRKTVRRIAEEAMPLVHAWCRKHEIAAPTPWDAEGVQALTRHLENQGLLDFEKLPDQIFPRLCHRAGCWPKNMGETLDRAALGLDEAEVRHEEKQREEARKHAEVERRTIQFAGTSLDTADADFSQNLRDIADGFLSSDDKWYERSSNRVNLATFLQIGGKTGGSGPGTKGKKGNRQLNEEIRKAMGLASEWLAYQYLRRRHPDYVGEESWVSENRQDFFGGSEGDDAAGYDFKVETPQTHWLYEVKSSLEDSGEFELTANELRVASAASKDRSRRYRILYVPHVFSPDKWHVLELPNPMGEKTRDRFETIGRGSVRLRFERRGQA